MRPKITIIIPFYNAADYIRRCCSSLFNQSMNEIQYIFIDDCSTDNSTEIINLELSRHPQRIPYSKIIRHYDNKGVSASRQHGVDLADGEYIIHVDADDWIESNMCTEMYQYAVANNLDILIADFYIEGKKTIISNQKPTTLDPAVTLCELFKHLHGSTWNKLIRNDFIKESGVQFDCNISYCEDLLYIVSLLRFNPIIGYINTPFYHYYYSQNPKSITRLYNNSEYLKDRYLQNKILQITKDTSAFSLSKNNTNYSISWRAFRGSNFTNRQYRSLFGRKAFSILSSNASVPIKALIVLSSLGFYRLVKGFYLNFLKHN